MRIGIGMLVLATMLGTPDPGHAQRHGAPLGAKVVVERNDRSLLRGELLAAGRDSAWLLVSRETLALPLQELARVRVRRPGLGPSHLAAWTLIGGLATGAALTGACSSVTEGCGGVFLGTMVLWGVVGGIATGITKSPDRSLPPDSTSLAPYARFPQGLPPNFPRPTPLPGPGTGPKP